MATEVEQLIVQLRATQRQFVRDMEKARRAGEKTARGIENRFDKMNKRIGAGTTRMARRLVGVFAGFASARGAGSLLESATRIENALRVVGLEGEALSKTLNDLYNVADRGRAPIESIVQLYSRLEQVSGSLGLKSNELINVTDSVSQAIRAQGIGANEARGALVQLSQALGEGIVRAQEFNSINEQLPVLLREAAAAMGVTRSELRNMVLDGELSSRQLADAIIAANDALTDLASKAQTTGAQGVTRLNNALIRAAEELNRGGQFTETFAGALENLASAIDDIDFTNLGNGLGAVVNLLGAGIERTNDMRRALTALNQVAADRLNESLGFNARQARRGRNVTGMRFPGPGGRGQPFAGPVDRGPGTGFRALYRGTNVSPPTYFGDIPSSRIPIPGVRPPFSLPDESIAIPNARASTRATRPAQDAAARRVAQQYKDATDAIKDMDRAQRDATRSVSEFGSVGSSVLTGFYADMRRGATAAEAMANALNKIGEALLNSAIQQIFGGGYGQVGAGIFGTAFGVSNTPIGVGLYHRGGKVGSPQGRRAVDPAAFASARRFHGGGVAGIGPGETPAILQNGEQILTRQQQRGMGGGGVSAVRIVLSPGLRGEILSQAANQTVQIVESGNTSRVAIGYNDARTRGMIR